MSEKPSLHEIAAMPFPASEQALEKYYGVKPKRADREGELKTYQVTVNYSWRGNGTAYYEVEAFTEEEAKELAGDEFDKDDALEGDDPEIDDCIIEEVQP